ncbi:MAG: nucleotidyltransferase domain-containing protein [Planctomycetes bacterium]|nr:nucleotidyltransferase domain-containing protein [Planctomycetota bacterium]
MNLPISQTELEAFCGRWKIVGLAAFGSVLRDDFNKDSDVDLLVEFAHDASWSLLDHIRMEEELAGLLQRRVDLVSQRAIEQSRNPIRRRAILNSARTLYAA